MSASNARVEKLRRIFAAALRLDPMRRRAFLVRECEGDEKLRSEIELLFRHHDAPQDFLGKASDSE